MDTDQYAYCPCGSGKKLKWCCQDIYKDIERAYHQLEIGQQDAAARIMADLVKAHPKNPEAWGKQAHLLVVAGNKEEGEKALEKALELNPQYPFGLFLKAQLRADEGEVAGALILARRAADAYHPDALDHVYNVYTFIYELEVSRNRPVAAHAALRVLIKCDPADNDLRQAEQSQYGPGGPMPPCARSDQPFLGPDADLAPERRKAWDEALGQVETPHFSKLAAAFARLTAEDPNDAAAWWNLGLVQAWLGENREALASLDRYLELEQDESRAARAGALAEVLRCGKGLEAESDYRTYVAEFQLRDPGPVQTLINGWGEARRLVVLPAQEESVLAALLLEPVAPAIVTSEAEAEPGFRLSCNLVVAGPLMRFWGSSEDSLRRVREEVLSAAGDAVADGGLQTLPMTTYGEVVSEALVFPPREKSQEKAKAAMVESAGKFFEEVWVHRPRNALAGNNPLDAAGHAGLRKKLLGVIQFLQDCSVSGLVRDYDFNRLRRKLGFAAAGGTTAPAAPGVVDVRALGAAELAELPVESLSDEQLEKAFQAAQKLDAGEVAAHFGRTLLGREVPAGKTADRWPVVAYLYQRAAAEGDHDAALDLVNEGQRLDCAHNEGRRRNDYELRRGQLHVRRREADQAREVFARLIERAPDNLSYRGSAAEGMLSLNLGGRAAEFAEAGVAEARRQKDRDAEHHLLGLLEEAKKRSR